MASYAALTLSVAIAVLWIHSYAARSSVELRGGQYSCVLSSWRGLLDLKEHCGDVSKPQQKLKWRVDVIEATRHRQNVDAASGWGIMRTPKPFTFNVRKNLHTTRDGRVYYGRVITLPYWSLCIPPLLLALLRRPAPRLRFGLRDAFAVTTLVALGAAAFAALTQMAAG
ncbi:hypothetical protein [Pseudobythopirellula maris]|uniref:hypothetical protein n=1 Tax=Pseudobythopirellula maris TaxID=2527991 RepID=UPI0011B4AC8E|nr:hypothetical protein [Pseudobythopirellula maris]